MIDIENKLLARQIRKYCTNTESIPNALFAFIAAVDATYQLAERDAALLRQSLVAVSEELNNRNLVLQQEKEEQNLLIKKLEEAHNQLLQSEKMASIGQLAAGVAHEINNPIGYVSSNLTSLKKYVKNLSEMLDVYEKNMTQCPLDVISAIRMIREKLDIDYVKSDISDLFVESLDGIEKVKKIVQDLKDFSHVDSIEQWELSDLHKGIDSALNIAANEIKYKATIVKEYGNIPNVNCLASQINQVFLNLLINAAHAIKPGEQGVIRITTGIESTNKIWIEIADNGCGIPQEIANKIFDPFFTTKPIGVGTGLGLSISYGIIKKHSGTISMSSEHGMGTCFRIILPIEQIENNRLSP